MRIDYLSLRNFRSYAHLETAMPSHTVVLHGDNAQGKTSLLEALYYLVTARSPHTTADRQLIHWRVLDDPLPFARIAADIHTQQHPAARIEITLMLEQIATGQRFRKVIKLNGVEQRVKDVVGILNVVLFLPQDLKLIEGGPSDRRRYMDDVLSQMDAVYLEARSTYDKTLTQRNALLRQIAANRSSAKELAYWDEELGKAGAVIIAARQQFLRELEYHAQTVHADLTHKRETLTLQYQPSFAPTADESGQRSFDALGFDLHRQLSADEIAPQFIAQLQREQFQAIQRGATLSGPHRDELRLHINERDVGLYGSRGQARTSVMALKLAEFAWMHERTGDPPLLLLDEVIAELDAKRRTYLLERLQDGPQTLLTTTEPNIFTPDFLQHATVWHVQNGQIQHPT